MKRTPLALLSRCSFTAAALLSAGPVLHAADRFWVSTTGGAFGAAANWSATDGGAGGATVPAAPDVAHFTLNSTYPTSFSANATLLALEAENGNVTLDLNSFTCTLTSGTGALYIGQVSGQAARLTVRDGVVAVDTAGDNVRIGDAPGSTGFLTVTTGGSLGTAVRPNVTAGLSGTGTLTVNDNGRLNGSMLILGNGTGSAGSATISGPNAVADFSSALTIGQFGSGTLTINGGGTFVGAAAVLGMNLGTDGAVSVSGAGSLWRVTGSAAIGSGGDGTLSVTSGGLAFTGTSTMGVNPTGFGAATVTGAGSRWEMGAQTIGSGGLGIMTVSSGGAVVSINSSIAANAGSEGRVTVTGSGSRWTVNSSSHVGHSGAGELTVSAGGEVLSATMILGNQASGSGVVTITGAGSRLSASTSVTVSPAGSGTLTVENGGELSTGSLTVIAPGGAAVGTVNLDGGSIYVEGSYTNTGELYFTDGLLQVRGNFQPRGGPGGILLDGDYHGDLPTLELIGSGSTTNVTGVTVGNSRRGQLLLREGRVLSIISGGIAGSAGGEGSVTVQSGAQFLISTEFGVGGGITSGGTGTLNISGGTVDAGTLRLFSGGTVNLSGGTLAFETAPILAGQINWTGGTLRFDAATAITSANAPKFFGSSSTLSTGQTLSSTAAVTLQTPLIVNGGMLAATSLFNQSRLELRSGFLGNVTNTGLLLGDGVVTGTVTNSGAGRIRVDAGKSLSFTGDFSNNSGQLTLQGGTVELGTAFTNSAGGFISGRGTILSSGILNNGQMAFSGGTTDVFGDIEITGGGRVATSGAGSVTTFWDDVIHNGTEIFTGAGCSTVFFGSQNGTGSFTGSGTIHFIGDLRPGNSPASVVMAPQVVFNPSNTLTLEIGGLTSGTQHDRITFTSTSTPQVEWSGTLAVTLISGFIPAAGQSFDVLDFDPARDAGSFSAITLPALPAGLAWDTSELYNTGIIRVVSSTGLTFAEWATASGIPDALPGGDHDSDGSDNATEFALGLFPPQPGAIEPNGSLFTYADGRCLRLLFTRPLDRSGVTLKVEASDDLTGSSLIPVGRKEQAD